MAGTCHHAVLQCSRTMLLAMTYDLCHGGHMVAEYPLLHTPVSKNHLAQEPTPGSAVKFSHNFFTRVVGFSCFWWM